MLLRDAMLNNIISNALEEECYVHKGDTTTTIYLTTNSNNYNN